MTVQELINGLLLLTEEELNKEIKHVILIEPKELHDIAVCKKENNIITITNIRD